MDSDEDIIDDSVLKEYSSSETIHYNSHKDDDENEIQHIERLCQCFMERYNDCPLFFMGSLEDACEKALNSNMMKERSPLLIYIHHEKALCTHIFSLNILCSGKMIEYLLDNYIIWPWDITKLSNQDKLINMWKKMFPNETIFDFSIENCPMLIGINKTNKYQIIPLMINDTLIRLKKKFDYDLVLKELKIFREEFDSFSYEYFLRKILNKDIIIEICKYLSLNDIVKAFTKRILIYLNDSNVKFHLIEPDETLSIVIQQEIQSEQIISLCSYADEFFWKIVIDYLLKFNQIYSLTLINLEQLESISQFGYYFPKLIRLSLRYNNEIGLNQIKTIFSYLPKSIQHFEIHSTRILCTHYEPQWLLNTFDCNYHIEYFLLDIDNYPLIFNDECYKQYSSCFLMTLIQFLRHIPYIRCLYLRINQYDFENLIEMKAWDELLYNCFRLRKVRFKCIGNNISLKKIEQIKQQWRNLRPLIQLQILLD